MGGVKWVEFEGWEWRGGEDAKGEKGYRVRSVWSWGGSGGG